MSEEFSEQPSADALPLGVVPPQEEAPATDAPATDAPGATIFICPACGTRYDEQTTCSNGHAPTETVAYDRETVSRADQGDADAIASVNETASSAAGNLAGVVPTEATPPPVPGDPRPTAVPDGLGGTPASAMTPDGVHPNVAAIGAAIADLEGAIRAARSALGLGG